GPIQLPHRGPHADRRALPSKLGRGGPPRRRCTGAGGSAWLARTDRRWPRHTRRLPYGPHRFLTGTAEPRQAEAAAAQVRATGRIALLGRHEIAFDPATDLVLDFQHVPDLHPNGMTLTAFDGEGEQIARQDYFSTGGGFFSTRHQLEQPAPDDRV